MGGKERLDRIAGDRHPKIMVLSDFPLISMGLGKKRASSSSKAVKHLGYGILKPTGGWLSVRSLFSIALAACAAKFCSRAIRRHLRSATDGNLIPPITQRPRSCFRVVNPAFRDAGY